LGYASGGPYEDQLLQVFNQWGKSGALRGKVKPNVRDQCDLYHYGVGHSGSSPSGGRLMTARGQMTIPWAIATLTVVLLAVTIPASAWDLAYKNPVKVRGAANNSSNAASSGVGLASRTSPGDWEVAAGRARSEILCQRRGYSFSLGMRPFFSSLIGSTKVLSRGGEGAFMNLNGHLRLPSEKTLWEFYSHLKMWDKIAARVEYVPWKWTGAGHIPTDGNFAGLLLRKDDAIFSDLNVTSLIIGGDYDVSFGRDVAFGPNADLYILKWAQRVSKSNGDAVDFSQTVLQPTIGGHLRYDPPNTGYFSWFKPFVEARFSWMNFDGLGLSTWDMAAGIAPPVSRNVDAGIKLGYKQWKLEGNRNRLFADIAVEGPYLDLSLQF
jgi:hypothetical protein